MNKVLIIIPPFFSISSPNIGPHIIQACGKKHGIDTRIAYSNIHFAKYIGYEEYNSIAKVGPSLSPLFGEIYFAVQAFNLSASKKIKVIKYLSDLLFKQKHFNHLMHIFHNLDKWINIFIDDLEIDKYEIIGCSSTFDQTAASISLFNKIKERNPNIITIMGGANCFDTNANELLKLCNNIDYIFSGEAELSFVDFIKDINNNNKPINKIIEQKHSTDLDSIPNLNYDDYYSQFKKVSNKKSTQLRAWIPYETSRGCWWGVKNKCLFCGLNKQHLNYRYKSPKKVIKELRELSEKYNSNFFFMVDNAFPTSYFKNLLPDLNKYLPNINILYEIKVITSLNRIFWLKKSGIIRLAVGIESLNNNLLKLMRKGTTLEDNITFLRHATSLEFTLYWNLLSRIPGDKKEDYQEIIELIPQIIHLHPPSSHGKILLTRFSPYVDEHEKYGIQNIKPFNTYNFIYPTKANKNNLALFFKGNIKAYSKRKSKTMEEFDVLINHWKALWEKEEVPILKLHQLSNNKFVLMDNRKINNNKDIMEIINKKQMEACFYNKKIDVHYQLTEEESWAHNKKLIYKTSNSLLSLVTSDSDMLLKYHAL